ncbi:MULTISPECIES: hypothetical protein [unclassified Nocardiopsis]|uniref:hypothetical protein n=1 Tax=Nocardiopsis TaxID=2013 RepID=UPI00387AD9A6
MRTLPDTDSSVLPDPATDPRNPSADLPAGWPHHTSHEKPPVPGRARTLRNLLSSPVDRNRLLSLVCTSAATAAVLLGLLGLSPLHRVFFGEPDSVGHCLRTDIGRAIPP